MKLHRDPKLALLRGLPLFSDCTPAELHEVAAIADELTLPAGKRLTTEGAAGQEFVVIVSGTADVYKRGEKVAELGPADFVGEIALLTGRPRSATVVATSPVTVLVIARPRFLTVVERLSGVRARLDAVMPLRDAS
jgi:CRP-like cAMP-binding protein